MHNYPIGRVILVLQAIIHAMDQLKLLGAIEHHDANSVSNFKTRVVIYYILFSQKLVLGTILDLYG